VLPLLQTVPIDRAWDNVVKDWSAVIDREVGDREVGDREVKD
jgi:hypothetical protein